MKFFNELWKPFLNKEKILIFLTIFVLLNINIFISYQDSLVSDPSYLQEVPSAGLTFFYDLFCIGTNPFLFMLLMLLLPNIMSYDFLNYQQSHFSYLIETRIKKNTYYKNIFIKNIIMTFCIILLIQILILITIHIFYAPLQFNTTIFPEHYYAKTQILASHEVVSLLIYLFVTSVGYALISSLIFSLQILISNKYIYRCFGVIFGILLVLIPALAQGYLPSPDFAFVFQINNLVALGMENVRANPFGFSHLILYIVSFGLYSLISFGAYQGLLFWRASYD